MQVLIIIHIMVLKIHFHRSAFPNKIDFHDGVDNWNEEGRYTLYTYQDRILNIIEFLTHWLVRITLSITSTRKIHCIV